MASQVPPKKNTAFDLGVTLYLNTGALVTNPGAITAKISKDFGDYADVGTVTEEDSTYGQIKLALTATEMNADVVMIYVTDNTSGTVPFTATIYTAANLMDDIKTDTAAILADTGTDGVKVATFANDAITAAAIQNGAIDLATFAADCKTGSALKANVETITNDAITAASINTGALTADAFAANAITNAAVADDVDVNVKTISANAITATAINADAITEAKIADAALSTEHFNAAFYTRLGIVAYGTAQAATSTTLQLAAASDFADDELNGAVVVITGGTGVGQSRVITNYTGSTDTAEVDAWTTTPSGTITYVVFAAAPASATSLPAVNLTQIAGSAVATGTAQLGVNVVSVTDDAITAASINTGAMTADAFAADAIVAATLATGAITADAFAADAITNAAIADDIDVNVKTITAGAITATAIATGAIDADSLAADAVAEIADGVWDEVVTTGAHDTATFAGAGLLAAASGGASAADIADAVWDEAATGHTDAGKAGAQLWTDVDAILADTGTDGVKVATFAADAIDAASIKADAGTEIGTAVWATAARTLTAATNITSTGGTTVPQTGDSFARLGAPAGASVSADIAAIEAQTDDIGVAGAGLTAIPTIAAVTTVGSVTGAVGSVAAGGITAASIATGAIDADALAADAGTELGAAVWATATRQLTSAQTFNLTGDITGNVSGSVGSVTGAVGSVTGNVGGSVGSVTGNVGGNVTGSVGSVTGNVGGNVAGSVASVTGNVAGSVGSIATGGISTASFATGAIDASALATDAVNEIVDQVWDETLAGHSGVGSTGAALSAAGGSGDPWSTAIPGGYGAGTAGYILGSNINAPIATVDTVVDAIKAKTDNLPASPAATGAAMTLAAGAVTAAVIATGAIDADAIAADAVAEIQNGLATGAALTTLDGKADNIYADVHTNGVVVATASKTGYALTTDGNNAVADALLDRNMATGVDSGSATVRTPRQALRFLRNKWALTGTTLSVMKENDSTPSWTAEVTTDAAADPITGNDPASS